MLDSNGVASITQSVRTGRDLAGLGNWLNFPDFLLQAFDVSCNAVVALSDIFSFSQLGMSGEHGHWACEVIKLYGGI